MITEVAAADKEDVNLAVKAARKAFESGPWRKMGGRERGKILYRLADLMEQHKEELAVLETFDNGKPLSLSRAADVPLSIDHYRCVWGLGGEGGLEAGLALEGCILTHFLSPLLLPQ